MPKDGSGVRLDGQGRPLWLCLELTYRCPLSCPWCSNPLDFHAYGNELATDEWKRVLAEGRALGALQLGFTGGEPLLRPDLDELVREADRLGFYTNLITSGVGLSERRLAALKDAGLKQIQLSIQSCEPATTNALVGAPVHGKKMAAARLIKDYGFPMVLNVPVLRQNIDQVEGILDMALDIGADYLEFANIQYYNWALLNRDELLPTRAQLERAERAVEAARARPDCKTAIFFVIPDYFDGRPKACMNGWGAIHLTIAPDGTALPCQECRVMKEVDFPSVREHALEWIWRDSPAFNLYRGDSWMREPCRSCADKAKDFAGCRCQAYLLTGDAANCDPACTKSPDHVLVAAAIGEAHRKDRPRRALVPRRAEAAASLAEGKTRAPAS